MIQETLKKVVTGQDLTYDEAYASMDEIFSGKGAGRDNGWISHSASHEGRDT